jgi:hypothetical protein
MREGGAVPFEAPELHPILSDADIVTKPAAGRQSFSEHQRELAAARCLCLRQRRKRDPEQTHSFSRWQERFVQAKAQALDVRETVDRVSDGLASCNLLKVGELHLQGDSPSPDAGRLALAPDQR